MIIELNSFDIDLAQKPEFKTKSIFGHNILVKHKLNDAIVKSLEDEVRFREMIDGLRFPFSLAAEKIYPHCFWTLYGTLLLVLAILERLLSASSSYVLFASPWGFIFDLLGMQATQYGPLLAFLIFVLFFGIYVYSISNALSKSLVFELVQTGEFNKYFDKKAKVLIFKDPSTKELRKGLITASLISLPSALIVVS